MAFFEALFSLFAVLLALVFLVIVPIVAIAVLVLLLLNKSGSDEKPYRRFSRFGSSMSEREMGSLGECLIARELSRVSGNNKVLMNCYIPKTDATTTEIDVLMIHETGVFVIESKNYSGWIFGSENQTQWTQTLRKGRRGSQKNHFYNPIMQNKAHIKWLEKYLEPLDIKTPFYSYVVFGNRCELKNITLFSNRREVVNECHLFGVVQNQISFSTPVLSLEQIELIYNKLFPLTQVSEADRQQHIMNIRHNSIQHGQTGKDSNSFNSYSQNIYQQTVSSNNYSNYCESKENCQVKTDEAVGYGGKKCPKCGSNLVLRTAKNGNNTGKQFWGCKNYPRCKYTEQLNN